MQAAELILDNKPALAPSPAWLRWLGKAVDWSVICIGGSLAALIFINVVMHAMHKDLAWLTELGELMMVWVTFLGGAAAAHRGAHMSINEFLDKLTWSAGVGPMRRCSVSPWWFWPWCCSTVFASCRAAGATC